MMLMWDTRGACRGLVLCALMWGLCLGKSTNDVTVTCTDSEQCVLPCQFQSDGKGVRIMWYKKGIIVSCTRHGDTSFVFGSNSQEDSYKGRTSLFTEQVLEGNGALTLRNITPHDQDKYFCVTMTASKSEQSAVVSLLIKAPVGRVDISYIDGVMACSSTRIYPRPSLVWSTDPPTETSHLHNWTITREDQHGFYDIQSSVQLKETHLSNKIFICRVATDTNQKTAFLQRQVSLACAGIGVTVPCRVPPSIASYNITWTYGHWDQILSIKVTEQEPLVEVSDRWKPRVSVNLLPHSLSLREVMRELQGTYSCEVHTPEETHITETEVTVQQDLKHVHVVYSVVCCFLVLLLIVLILTFKRHFFKKCVGGFTRRKQVQEDTADNSESEELQEP